MDELLPKATGHQARIEKKRVLNQQRREKDTSPGKVDIYILCMYMYNYMYYI